MNAELKIALTSYTKEQLYIILSSLSSKWQMSKTEWKSYKKTDYYDLIIEEIYNDYDDDEVEGLITGIIKKEEWVTKK